MSEWAPGARPLQQTSSGRQCMLSGDLNRGSVRVGRCAAGDYFWRTRLQPLVHIDLCWNSALAKAETHGHGLGAWSGAMSDQGSQAAQSLRPPCCAAGGNGKPGRPRCGQTGDARRRPRWVCALAHCSAAERACAVAGICRGRVAPMCQPASSRGCITHRRASAGLHRRSQTRPHCET